LIGTKNILIKLVFTLSFLQIASFANALSEKRVDSLTHITKSGIPVNQVLKIRKIAKMNYNG